MNREQMIQKATDILPYHWRTNPPGGQCACGHETPLGGRTSTHVARIVLDAILPQVATVEELDALPRGSKVVDAYGSAWGSGEDLDNWFSTDDNMVSRSELIFRGPLTVVWQP